MTIAKFLLRLIIILATCGHLVAESLAAEPVYSLVQQWQVKNLEHQPEANEVFHRDGFVYVGGGAPEGKVAKVKMETGAVAWSYDTNQTYQPSYPVSNGRVVIFGTYYGENFGTEPYFRTFFVGLDDQTGKLLWKIPAGQQNMSAACFADDLAFVGSYDRNLYAIDWAKGETKWKTQLGNLIWSTPCVYDNLVVVGCYDGKLYCIDRKTGKIDSKIDCGGRIESNPVVANGLLFVLVDAQSYGDDYDSSKTQKTMLVINMQQKKIIARFTSESIFSKKVVVSGDEVYFFDRDFLYSYHSQRATLSWKVKAPSGMAPYPILTPTKVILAMNYQGHHGDHSSKMLVLDRATGKELLAQELGGIGMRQAHYAQSGNMVVTVDWNLVGYKIAPIP
jgi:outer membrane protein assembly factor BamB